MQEQFMALTIPCSLSGTCSHSTTWRLQIIRYTLKNENLHNMPPAFSVQNIQCNESTYLSVSFWALVVHRKWFQQVWRIQEDWVRHLSSKQFYVYTLLRVFQNSSGKRSHKNTSLYKTKRLSLFLTKVSNTVLRTHYLLFQGKITPHSSMQCPLPMGKQIQCAAQKQIVHIWISWNALSRASSS